MDKDNFLNLKIGDIVLCEDEYSRELNAHFLQITHIERDKEYSTETNPEGVVCYGDDLQDWGDDYITRVTEENFCGKMNNVLEKLSLDDFSYSQITVLSDLADNYGEEVALAVADCQIESNMMQMVGESIGKKYTTLEDIEDYISNFSNGKISSIYEACESQEDYDKLYNYLEEGE